MLFSLEKTRVKPGTVLIETVLSGDYLYSIFFFKIAACLLTIPFRSLNWGCDFFLTNATFLIQNCEFYFAQSAIGGKFLYFRKDF